MHSCFAPQFLMDAILMFYSLTSSPRFLRSYTPDEMSLLLKEAFIPDRPLFECSLIPGTWLPQHFWLSSRGAVCHLALGTSPGSSDPPTPLPFVPYRILQAALSYPELTTEELYQHAFEEMQIFFCLESAFFFFFFKLCFLFLCHLDSCGFMVPSGKSFSGKCVLWNADFPEIRLQWSDQASYCSNRWSLKTSVPQFSYSWFRVLAQSDWVWCEFIHFDLLTV